MCEPPSEKGSRHIVSESGKLGTNYLVLFSTTFQNSTFQSKNAVGTTCRSMEADGNGPRGGGKLVYGVIRSSANEM